MNGRKRPLLVTRFALMWRGCSRRCRPEIGYELICVSRVRRRGWISGPAGDESTDRFHAIDSRPVWWTRTEAGDWSSVSAVDRDCASGLVSSLVISVVVSRSTGWGHTRGQSGFDNLLTSSRSRPQLPVQWAWSGSQGSRDVRPLAHARNRLGATGRVRVCGVERRDACLQHRRA